MDGPIFATYLRDRLERQLREQGELPFGVTLDASSSFRQMTGSGELWVDARGLPLRLALHLAFPEERDGSRLEADIQTDFSGFPEQVAAAPTFTEDPLAWAGTALPDEAAKAGGTGGALACSLGAVALLLACRRSRRLYAAVVIAVILSMVVVPLMQSERAVAFFERQDARSRNLAGLGAAGQAIRDARQRGRAGRPGSNRSTTWRHPGTRSRTRWRSRTRTAPGSAFSETSAVGAPAELPGGVRRDPHADPDAGSVRSERHRPTRTTTA